MLAHRHHKSTRRRSDAELNIQAHTHTCCSAPGSAEAYFGAATDAYTEDINTSITSGIYTYKADKADIINTSIARGLYTHTMDRAESIEKVHTSQPHTVRSNQKSEHAAYFKGCDGRKALCCCRVGDD